MKSVCQVRKIKGHLRKTKCPSKHFSCFFREARHSSNQFCFFSSGRGNPRKIIVVKWLALETTQHWKPALLIKQAINLSFTLEVEMELSSQQNLRAELKLYECLSFGICDRNDDPFYSTREDYIMYTYIIICITRIEHTICIILHYMHGWCTLVAWVHLLL
jgi:hypothetical protein